MTAADLDLRSTLTDQHRQVKTLMGEVLQTSGDRQAAFDQFRCFLAYHEAAEEECIHSYRDRLGAESEVADERLIEEQEAGQVIAELEGLLVNSDEFRARFEQLAQSVIAHAEAEEHEELPVLDQLLGEDDLIRIRGILEQVPELARQANAAASFQHLLETAKSQFSEQV